MSTAAMIAISGKPAILRLCAFALTLFAVAGLNPPAIAAGKELLVVPIDVDREALRRDDPVTRRILSLVGTALVERGQVVRHDDWFEPKKRLGKRFVHSAADWVREARRAKSRADAMIALKSYEISDHRGDGRALRIEIRARIYDLPLGRVVFETDAISAAGSVVPNGCDRACEADAVTPALETTAARLAELLVERLPQDRDRARLRRQSETPGLREYHLEFKGFKDDDMRRISAYLEKFSGFQSLDTLAHTPCSRSMAYLSQISRSKLEANFRRMFRELRAGDVRLRFDTLRVEARRSGCVP
jgi:hypothetical protein